MTFWIADWLRAFGVTIVCELAIALPLLRRAEPNSVRRAACIVIANLATHPIVWFVVPGAALSVVARFWLSEAWAFGAEAIIYAVIWPALGPRRAALVSACANAVSVLVGLALKQMLLL